MNLVLIGPPGSGKGTQAARLAQAWGVPRISTGDILRQAAESGDVSGESIRDALNSGALVGDDVVERLVAGRLADAEASRGSVLDGFPRTVEQAVALDDLMKGRGALIVVELAVPEDELLRRLSQRGRTDDGDEIVRERLAIYTRMTAPVIDFYKTRQTLRTINGNLPEDSVTERINLAIDPIFDRYFDSLAGIWKGMPFSVNDGNAQKT